MPPKQQGGGSKVARDDKTFGMKNKNKSAKVQKFIQQVDQQSKTNGKSPAQLAKELALADRAKAKLLDEKRRKEEAALMNKPIQAQQKVAFGVDPKTVLCVFFKAGHCEKGNKCKFSHDKNIERKTQKANLYEDVRDKKDEKTLDTMELWDEEKLRDVVLSKTGNPKTSTDIVCKYFIQAIEDQKYGWFWECPNGVDCKYRHALPPGFVLKADKKAREDAAKKEVISLEDFLETERHKLKAPLTPVTPETFAVWKKTRVDKKVAEAEAKEKAKAAARAAGKVSGMSGKDLFDFSSDMLGDEDEDDEDEWDLQRYLASREDEDDVRVDDDDAGDPDDDDDGTEDGEGTASASGSGTTEGVANGMSSLTVAS